jgi:hypothetical protein
LKRSDREKKKKKMLDPWEKAPVCYLSIEVCLPFGGNESPKAPMMMRMTVYIYSRFAT